MRENGPLFEVWVDFPDHERATSCGLEVMPASSCLLGWDFFIGSYANEKRRYWSFALCLLVLRFRVQRWITPLSDTR